MENDAKSPDLRQAIIVSPNPNPLLIPLDGIENLKDLQRLWIKVLITINRNLDLKNIIY